MSCPHGNPIGCCYQCEADDELTRLRAEVEALRGAIGLAYGWLWCVNNEPGTPRQFPPEKAAYEARKVLRDWLTKEQRGQSINLVRATLDAAIAKAEKEAGNG